MTVTSVMGLLGKVRRSLRRAGPRDPAFAPDYTDAALFSAVRTAVAAGRTPALACAMQAWQSGRTDEARAIFVHYFAQRRPQHRFFVDIEELQVRDDPLLHTWIARAVADATVMTETGLPVYAKRTPPLAAGFPWADAVGEAESDLLYAAHVHRFQFVPRLALAAAVGAYPSAQFALLLDDWMAFASSGSELAFCSNLVVAQRVFAVGWAWAFLGAQEADFDVRHRLLRILVQDIAYLTPRLGRSYPNNHLLVDRFAAWYIALLYPELGDERPDLARRDADWQAELVRQTYDDGGGFEHSTHYHGLACEMAAAYLLLATTNGVDVAPAMRERIARMLRLQSALAGPDGHACTIGDSSDDPLFPPDGGKADNAAALREIHRALFAPTLEPLAAGHPARERAWWMLGGKLAPAPVACDDARGVDAPAAGFAVFAHDAEATRLVFRTGPLAGTRYIPGHMHDDALGVTFVHRGVPVIVEAGTFTYRYRARATSGAEEPWRTYFAGPRAHNGLVVDDAYPCGRLEADFRSDRPLAELGPALCARGTEVALVEAQRARGSAGPAWIRGVVQLAGVGFLVYDIVERYGGTPHFAFQCAHDTEVALAQGAALLRTQGTTTTLAWDTSIGPAECVAGREQPTNGWISPAYGVLLKAPQLLLRGATDGRLTAFYLGSAAANSVAVECVRPAPEARAFRLARNGVIDVVLVHAGAVPGIVEAFGCTFHGRIAWLQVLAGAAPVVRWVAGSAFHAPAHGLHHRLGAAIADFAG